MNKLLIFNLNSDNHPFDHISEIVSLIHLSLSDTPLAKVLEKFAEVLIEIKEKIKREEKRIENDLNNHSKKEDIF